MKNKSSFLSVPFLRRSIRNRALLIVALAGAFLLPSGCENVDTQVTKMGEGSISLPEPPPGKAIICFFCKPGGMIDRTPVYLDKRMVGAITSDTWTYVTCDPGTHSAVAGTPIKKDIHPSTWERTAKGWRAWSVTDWHYFNEAVINASSGGRYFVEVNFGIQAWGTPNQQMYTGARQVSESRGLSTIQSKKFSTLSKAATVGR